MEKGLQASLIELGEKLRVADKDERKTFSLVIISSRRPFECVRELAARALVKVGFPRMSFGCKSNHAADVVPLGRREAVRAGSGGRVLETMPPTLPRSMEALKG